MSDRHDPLRPTAIRSELLRRFRHRQGAVAVNLTVAAFRMAPR